MKKPSAFTRKPWDCIFQKSEYETIACNIMVILERTGDEFRPLEWEEYKTKRLKDGNFTMNEKQYFDKVVFYCQSAENAEQFSNEWKK